MEKHQHDTYERASEVTNQVKRLMGAAYNVADDLNHTREQLDAADTLFVLLNLAGEKMAELEKAHQMIWVAMGGKSLTLSDDDIKAARGEVA